jgi:DNA-binding MarR family transcriptional regulator
MWNRLKPKQEHLEAVLAHLQPKELLTPKEIAKRSGLTLNAVNGAVETLAVDGRVRIVRQAVSPKVLVGLSERAK